MTQRKTYVDPCKVGAYTRIKNGKKEHVDSYNKSGHWRNL